MGKLGSMNKRIEPLITWLRKTDEADAKRLLESQGTTIGYARQVAYGNKTPSGEKSSAIERASGVSRRDLRPNDWRLVWPELAEKIGGRVPAET